MFVMECTHHRAARRLLFAMFVMECTHHRAATTTDTFTGCESTPPEDTKAHQKGASLCVTKSALVCHDLGKSHRRRLHLRHRCRHFKSKNPITLTPRFRRTNAVHMQERLSCTLPFRCNVVTRVAMQESSTALILPCKGRG